METHKSFDKQQKNRKKVLGKGVAAEGDALIDLWPPLAALIDAEIEKRPAPRGLFITLGRLNDSRAIAVNVLYAALTTPAILPIKKSDHANTETKMAMGRAILSLCKVRRKKVFGPKGMGAEMPSEGAAQILRDRRIRVAPYPSCCVGAHGESSIRGDAPKPRVGPIQEPPAPWTGFREGAFWDEESELSSPAVRTHNKKAERAIRKAWEDGTLQRHIEAMSSQQSVVWMIDEKMLEVVNHFGPYHRRALGEPPLFDTDMKTEPDWKALLRASELRLARQILRNPVFQFPAPGLGPRAFSFRARNRQGGTSLAEDSLRFARQQIQRPWTRVFNAAIIALAIAILIIVASILYLAQRRDAARSEATPSPGLTPRRRSVFRRAAPFFVARLVSSSVQNHSSCNSQVTIVGL